MTSSFSVPSRSKPASASTAGVSLFSGVRSYFRRRFDAWLKRRVQPGHRQHLNNRRLFIFPSRAGWGYLTMTLVLWLLGTNYENNMILGLAFFLTALFIVCIHHTFFNMTGLQLEYIKSAPAFLGEDAEVEIELSHRARSKENILLGYPQGSQAVVDLLDEHSARVKLFVPTTHRGLEKPSRLLVESVFPLGLLRCWSWLDLDVELLVYPRALSSGQLPSGQGNEREGDQLDEHGSDDFYGFKNYQPGMSLRHIAWKQYARGQGLHSKEYVSYREQALWLDWDALQGGREARLSQLCYWVLKLGATHQPYGLRLPGNSYPPATGLEHKQQLLKALALFEWQADQKVDRHAETIS